MKARRRYRMIALLLSCLAIPGLASGAGLGGTIRGTDGAPMAFAYVGLLDTAFAPVDQAISELDGRFTLGHAAQQGFLVVQPPPREDATGHNAYPYQPRIYALAGDESELDLRLPPAVSIILEAYDGKGRLLRWQDFQKLGVHGGQFMYATNLQDEAVPAACWPVHGRLTGAKGGSREEGLPAILAEPGQDIAVNVLFWPTQGYGKLLLRADNNGAGYAGKKAGASRLVLLNLELARTAVHALESHQGTYEEAARAGIGALRERLGACAQSEDRAACAAAADAILAEALRLRDRLELERARAEIPRVRKGTLEVCLENLGGLDPADVTISLEQGRHDFLFGAFEGSPYNGEAFETARKAGFEYATVLLGWNWTASPAVKTAQIDHVFGISKLRELGYRIKAHGVVWMQDYGILPERAKRMDHAELCTAALEHQQALLKTFGESIDVWEAMNEPANTNVVGLARADMLALLGTAASNIAALGKPALVNSPHEFSYGAKFLIHGRDNLPKDGYPLTFSAFLGLPEAAGALEGIETIGLQFYPGFHLNEDFGGQQGPAYTPAYILDTLDRYRRFGKTLHITELSMPSSYRKDWFSGYWREPWTEATQADYAEAVFTLAFAHPQVQSVGWWDIMDSKPSVITGGLLHEDGSPKPVFARLESLIAAWTTHEEEAPDAEGKATFAGYGGDYILTVLLPDGREISRGVHLLERQQAEMSIDVGAAQ